MEYASAVIAPCSRSQLDKLEVIQRIAARIIMGLPHDAHAAPLLEALRLPSLEIRRREHVAALVEKALSGLGHEALNLFRVDEGGVVTSDMEARIGVGRKRFGIHGALVYNECSH